MQARETTRVLIVEDNPADVKFFTYALKLVEARPLETTIARDGREAVDFLLDPKTEPPDLVILDKKLLKSNGTELLQVLKITNHLYGLPVVAFGSAADDAILKQITNANFE